MLLVEFETSELVSVSLTVDVLLAGTVPEKLVFPQLVVDALVKLTTDVVLFPLLAVSVSVVHSVDSLVTEVGGIENVVLDHNTLVLEEDVSVTVALMMVDSQVVVTVVSSVTGDSELAVVFPTELLVKDVVVAFGDVVGRVGSDGVVVLATEILVKDTDTVVVFPVALGPSVVVTLGLKVDNEVSLLVSVILSVDGTVLLEFGHSTLLDELDVTSIEVTPAVPVELLGPWELLPVLVEETLVAVVEISVALEGTEEETVTVETEEGVTGVHI